MAVFALALAGASAAAPRDSIVVPSVRLGAFEFYPEGGKRVGSYEDAVAAFGKADAKGTVYQSNICTVRWTKRGIDLDFASTLKPCANLLRGSWYGATVYTSRWRTNRGLRVGDTVQRMRSLYPKARFVNRPPDQPEWVLLTRRVDEFTFTPLVATAWGGRVTAIMARPEYVY